MSDYSTQYLQAIAYIAQAIYESGLLMRISRYDLDWFDLWISVNKLLPELQQVAYKVEEELDYELSYNQCCNAVAWVYTYRPDEWEHLIGSKCNIRESWLWNNQDALDSVQRGLKQAAEGKRRYIGSFAQYANPLADTPAPQKPLPIWL